MFDTTTTLPDSLSEKTATAKAVETVVQSVDFAEVQKRNAVLGTVEVNWETFSDLPRHPNQRFTSRHAAQLAASRVLTAPLDLHRQVDVVIVGDVEISRELWESNPMAVFKLANVCKLNGHSRTLAQKEGHAPKPETVLVTVHAAVDAAESARLYAAFDSPTSSKKGADKGQSALTSAGINPTSALFQSAGGVVQALRIAEAIIDEGTVAPKFVNKKVTPEDEMTVTEALEHIVPALKQAKRFKEHLEFLDGLNLTAKWMATTSPALAAYIAILERDPEKGREFLNAMRLAKGVVESNRADAVYVACNVLRNFVMRKLKLTGTARTEHVVAVILNAFDGYLTDTTFDSVRYPAQISVIASLFDHERRAAAKAVK